MSNNVGILRACTEEVTNRSRFHGWVPGCGGAAGKWLPFGAYPETEGNRAGFRSLAAPPDRADGVLIARGFTEAAGNRAGLRYGLPECIVTSSGEAFNFTPASCDCACFLPNKTPQYVKTTINGLEWCHDILDLVPPFPDGPAEKAMEYGKSQVEGAHYLLNQCPSAPCQWVWNIEWPEDGEKSAGGASVAFNYGLLSYLFVGMAVGELGGYVDSYAFFCSHASAPCPEAKFDPAGITVNFTNAYWDDLTEMRGRPPCNDWDNEQFCYTPPTTSWVLGHSGTGTVLFPS